MTEPNIHVSPQPTTRLKTVDSSADESGMTVEHQFGLRVPSELSETRSLQLEDTSPSHISPDPNRIGPFRLLSCLGEGGMGSVWIAEQTEPVKRKVALKLIKAGIGSKEILVRFESERRALALMDHPNIARILDAGTGPNGQPWFAMELVTGIPLAKYCDTHQLNIEQRLELFCDICSGVQHAHQKGIIHRDLKPGNIVVTTIDAKPIPKVIDFGLAKAMESTEQLTEHSAQTSIGQILGTLKYMSPEQASFESIDIDTRTDIYALGVILYELLIGLTPLDDQSVRGEPLIRVLQRIREQEPVRPASRLRAMPPADIAALVSSRRTDAVHLNRVLVGDLDWIVLKALEKDRSRRYASVNGFQQDVRRFLDHEPVNARPPSRKYRMQKFVRKNRVFVTSAGLLTAALIAGIVGTTWGMLAANRARFQSQNRLTQIELGNTVLAGIFQDLNIDQIEADDEPLEAVLAKRLVQAATKLDASSFGDPTTVSLLKNQLADSLLNLGFSQEAIALFDGARELREAALGSDHSDTLDTMNGLGEAYLNAGNYEAALPVFEVILQKRTELLGAKHIDTLDSMSNLAETLRRLGRLEEATPLMKVTFERRKETLGTDNRDTLTSMNNLALTLQQAGEIEPAISIFEDAVEIAKAKLGIASPTTLTAMNNLAVAYRDSGQMSEALALYEQTHDLLESKRGENHPDTLVAANNLAEAFRSLGRLDEAIPLYETTLDRMKVKLGERHPETLTCMNNLGDGYYADARFDDAIAIYLPTLQLMKQATSEHPFLLNCLQGLAQSYWKNGQSELAIPMYEESLKWQETNLGRKNYDTLSSMANLGTIYRDCGRLGEAISLLEETATMIPEFPSLSRVRPELRGAYARAGRVADVIGMLETDIDATRTNFAEGSTELAASLALIGFDLIGIRDYDRAARLLRESLAIRLEKLPHDWRTFYTQSMLGEAIVGQSQMVLDSDSQFRETTSNDLLTEASTLLHEGYAGLKAVQETIATVSRTERLGQSIDRLIELARLQGDDGARQQWNEEKEAVLKNDKKPDDGK